MLVLIADWLLPSLRATEEKDPSATACAKT